MERILKLLSWPAAAVLIAITGGVTVGVVHRDTETGNVQRACVQNGGEIVHHNRQWECKK